MCRIRTVSPPRARRTACSRARSRRGWRGWTGWSWPWPHRGWTGSICEKAGGFREIDARGGAFANARLAAGAGELRDLFILAWRDAADDSIGWPTVKVAEVEAGTADPWLSMIGED